MKAIDAPVTMVGKMSKWEWRQFSTFILKIFHSSGCNVVVWADLGTAAWGSVGIGFLSSLSALGFSLAEAPQAAQPQATLHPGERAGTSPSMGRWLSGLYLRLTTSGRQKKRIDLRIMRNFQINLMKHTLPFQGNISSLKWFM